MNLVCWFDKQTPINKLINFERQKIDGGCTLETQIFKWFPLKMQSNQQNPTIPVKQTKLKNKISSKDSKWAWMVCRIKDKQKKIVVKSRYREEIGVFETSNAEIRFGFDRWPLNSCFLPIPIFRSSSHFSLHFGIKRNAIVIIDTLILWQNYIISPTV